MIRLLRALSITPIFSGFGFTLPNDPASPAFGPDQTKSNRQI